MAASCCAAMAAPSVSCFGYNRMANVAVCRALRICCITAHADAASLRNDFGRSEAKVTSRNVRVRAERDPFAEFSAAFVEDVEEDEERASGGMTDAERDAIIAFETGGGAAVAEETDDEDSSEEDLWEERTVKDPRISPPKPKQGKGEVICNMLALFLGLLERPFGSDGRMIAAAGGAVTERVEEEVEKLRGVEGVDEQHLFEILRVVRLVQMDLQLVSAARKDQTLMERIMQTAVHTKQALDIANSL